MVSDLPAECHHEALHCQLLLIIELCLLGMGFGSERSIRNNFLRGAACSSAGCQHEEEIQVVAFW